MQKPELDKIDSRFRKGERRSPATEFKPGEHAYREWQPHWDFDWLYFEYVVVGKSPQELAEETGTTVGNIGYWLRKHQIPTRSQSEVRANKYWGITGEKNGMYGKRGSETPSWKGGITPDRQAFYRTEEWKLACSTVWKRDGAQCRRCNAGPKDKKLHVHHIVSFAVVELRANVDNLVLLCVDCHRWVHSKKNTNQEFIKNATGEN